MSDDTTSLEPRIEEWRTAILRGRTVDHADADELEGHLRDQIADLASAGLTTDEAFLIAVRRLGEVDAITAEFAREHGDRLWKQLTITTPEVEERRRPLVTMLAFAALAAVLVQVARLLVELHGSDAWAARNLGLFVLPVLAAYFVAVRRMPWRRTALLGGVVAAVTLAVNLFPFPSTSSTDILVAIHLPVALWFAVGVAYVGGDIRSSAKRMDFVRFTGEWAIYYALIALGGGVLMGLTAAVLSPIAPDAMEDVILWVVPSGAAGAVVVAAWLVEAKKSVIENLAPVLTAIFTPLFGVMLVVAAIAYTAAGVGREFDRELLTVFDVLLLVVLGLVVYGISARDSLKRAGVMDVIRLVTVIAAIVLDLLILYAMFTRVGELGFTPNRVAALGLNLLLLVNLGGTVWFTARQLAGRAPALHLERWQTEYLLVFAGWVAAVLLIVPPVFGFA
jgi:FtsH-binding integral membrane protein